jgi:hypothetical protein
MTKEQIEIILRIMHIEAGIAAHSQTPPKHWREELESLKEELRATARGQE